MMTEIDDFRWKSKSKGGAGERVVVVQLTFVLKNKILIENQTELASVGLSSRISAGRPRPRPPNFWASWRIGSGDPAIRHHSMTDVLQRFGFFGLAQQHLVSQN
jgi:hypothetical protein